MSPQWVLSGLLLGCGSGGALDSGGVDGSFPSDWSAEGIAAFVADEQWRDPPWVAESDAPRAASSVSSPHGRVQVFLNDVLLASAEAGQGAYGGTAHDSGSMAVKVLVDDDDQVIGHAAMLKLDGDFGQWVYWCAGPGTRCGAGSDAVETWGIGLETDCGYCHGGVVFNAG